MDLNTTFGDPGLEHKEDIESGSRAAASGGFTAVCIMPNTLPAIHSKSEVEYVCNKSKGNLVDVYPVGAVSKNCDGKEITEMYDMHQAGAVAFSDGEKPIENAGLMERALLYVKPINSLIFSHPEEVSISNHGNMNEGVTSATLGLHSAAALAEELAVARDIYLAEYTGSNLHFLNISTKKSAELVKSAKKKGLKVTASVNACNLFFDDAEIEEYETNLKVNPHLRTREDVIAVQKALKDGTIDTISGGHKPQDEESKKMEFDLAEFGMIGLETAFAAANTAFGKKNSSELIVEKFGNRPREILGLKPVLIEENQKANLTIFDPDIEWIFSASDVRSKSKNTPFINRKIKGKVLGVINNNQCAFN